MAFINILLLLPKDCAPGGLFRDAKRNGDAHFGSRAGPAPYTESRAHLLCPVTHSAKTPVQTALCLNGLRASGCTCSVPLTHVGKTSISTSQRHVHAKPPNGS